MANRPASKLAKALRQGKIDRQMLAMLRPHETAGDRDDFYKKRDIKTFFGPGVDASTTDNLRGLTKTGWGELDRFMTKRGWQVDDAFYSLFRYTWPVEYGGADVVII